MERLDWLGQYVDAGNAARTCLYLVSCCSYLPEADDMAVLRTAYAIHLAQANFPDAMRLALKLNDKARPPVRCRHGLSATHAVPFYPRRVGQLPGRHASGAEAERQKANAVVRGI